MDFGSILVIIIGVILFCILAPMLGVVFFGFGGVAAFFIVCVIIGVFALELLAPVFDFFGNIIGGGIGFLFKAFIWLLIIGVVTSVISAIFSFFSPKKNNEKEQSVESNESAENVGSNEQTDTNNLDENKDKKTELENEITVDSPSANTNIW